MTLRTSCGVARSWVMRSCKNWDSPCLRTSWLAGGASLLRLNILGFGSCVLGACEYIWFSEKSLIFMTGLLFYALSAVCAQRLGVARSTASVCPLRERGPIYTYPCEGEDRDNPLYSSRPVAHGVCSIFQTLDLRSGEATRQI